MCTFKSKRQGYFYSAGSVCVSERTESGEPRRPGRHYAWRLPTRGPPRPRIFVSPLLIRDCVSQLLLTCFFQSRGGSACCCFLPFLRLTLWLPNRNTTFPQTQTLEFSGACSEKWLWAGKRGKISILNRAVDTSGDTGHVLCNVTRVSFDFVGIFQGYPAFLTLFNLIWYD